MGRLMSPALIVSLVVLVIVIILGIAFYRKHTELAENVAKGQTINNSNMVKVEENIGKINAALTNHYENIKNLNNFIIPIQNHYRAAQHPVNHPSDPHPVTAAIPVHPPVMHPQTQNHSHGNVGTPSDSSPSIKVDTSKALKEDDLDQLFS